MGKRTKPRMGSEAQREGLLVTKPYTKPSRYNIRLSFEQYQLLLHRKKKADASGKRIRYKDLIDMWGIRQSVIGTALYRGIKQYDYILWKQGKENSLPLLQATTTPFVQNSERRPDNVCT